MSFVLYCGLLVVLSCFPAQETHSTAHLPKEVGKLIPFCMVFGSFPRCRDEEGKISGFSIATPKSAVETEALRIDPEVPFVTGDPCSFVNGNACRENSWSIPQNNAIMS